MSLLRLLLFVIISVPVVVVGFRDLGGISFGASADAQAHICMHLYKLCTVHTSL